MQFAKQTANGLAWTDIGRAIASPRGRYWDRTSDLFRVKEALSH